MVDSKTALEQIKETEMQAEEIIALAKEEARGILQEAGREKERLIKEARAKARLACEGLRLQIEKEKKEELALIEVQTENNIRSLKEIAGSNLDKAVQFLKEQIKLAV